MRDSSTPFSPTPAADGEDDALLPFQRLDVYKVAREFTVAVKEAGIRDAELQDQAIRAAISAFLTLAEGLPNKGPGLRRKYFTESNNSLHETIAAVDLATAIGALDPARASRIQELGLRFRKMLYKLRA
jgi:four helix bundle protein